MRTHEPNNSSNEITNLKKKKTVKNPGKILAVQLNLSYVKKYIMNFKTQ